MFRKNLIIILVGFCLLIFVSNFMFKEKSHSVPAENQVIKQHEQTIYINKLALNVEIADESHEQSQGLSGRESLEENDGMLFIFLVSYIPSFWMKDMNFALDMLWIDENGKIVEITKNISPDTFPATFSPTSPVRYVLEVNAGWSDKNKIRAGDLMELDDN